MSASPVARQAATHCQLIPSKRVLITDPAQMPDLYSTTPGGTLYSTTPGGTRIVYERAFLMNLRDSPISRTPPNNLPSGLLRCSKDAGGRNSNRRSPPPAAPPRHAHTIEEEHVEQFDMDM